MLNKLILFCIILFFFIGCIQKTDLNNVNLNDLKNLSVKNFENKNKKDKLFEGETPLIKSSLSPSNPSVGETFTLTVKAESSGGVKGIKWESSKPFSNHGSNDFFECNLQKTCSNTWQLIPAEEGLHKISITVTDSTGKESEKQSLDLIVGPIVGPLKTDINKNDSIKTTNGNTELPVDSNKEKIETKIEEKVKAEEVPVGSIALFYSTSMQTVQDKLTAVVDEVEGGLVVGGYVKNITWESHQIGVLRYAPEVDRLDVIKTASSPSYAKKALYPFTFNNKLYVLSDWGADWAIKNDQFNIEEIDPRTGIAKSASITFYGGNFAIIGDKLYYRKTVKEDLFGKKIGGGQLIVKSFKDSVEKELLSASDPSNKGILYGVGNNLLSVVYDEGTKTSSIKQLNLETARVEKTLHEGIPSGQIYGGSDALYILQGEGQTKIITRYPLQGQLEDLFEVELDQGESIQLDEDKGKILISTQVFKTGQGIVTRQLSLYNLALKEVKDIPLKEFSPSGNTALGGQFLIME